MSLSSVHFVSFRLVSFLTGQGNQLADIDMKDGGGDFDIDSCRKWEKLRATQQDTNAWKRQSHAHWPRPIPIPVPISNHIYLWHMCIMKIKARAQVFQVPQEEMHSQWRRESSESCLQHALPLPLPLPCCTCCPPVGARRQNFDKAEAIDSLIAQATHQIA